MGQRVRRVNLARSISNLHFVSPPVDPEGDASCPSGFIFKRSSRFHRHASSWPPLSLIFFKALQPNRQLDDVSFDKKVKIVKMSNIT
jgi:hypothetical protein